MKMNETKSELNVTYIGVAAVIAKAFGLDAMLQKLTEVQAWMPVDAGTNEQFYYIVLAIVLGYGAQRYGVKRLSTERKAHACSNAQRIPEGQDATTLATR
jgi:hypothetical protein